MFYNHLLTGIVGSQAYGLATPDSDIDRFGIYAVSTQYLFKVEEVRQNFFGKNSKGDDEKFHEIGKYAKLALSVNPTFTELMWLDEYEYKHDLGQELIDIRSAFLSRKRARDAYFGYATSQFKRLQERGDGSFSSDTRKRTAKHARHLARLLHQGYNLYITGELSVKLTDPDFFHNFGNIVADGDLSFATAYIGQYEEAFNNAKSPLPAEPNTEVVNEWLCRVRMNFL